MPVCTKHQKLFSPGQNTGRESFPENSVNSKKPMNSNHYKEKAYRAQKNKRRKRDRPSWRPEPKVLVVRGMLLILIKGAVEGGGGGGCGGGGGGVGGGGVFLWGGWGGGGVGGCGEWGGGGGRVYGV